MNATKAHAQHRAQDHAHTRRRVPPFALLLLIVVAIGAAVLVFARQSTPKARAETAPVTISGATLPLFGQGVDTAVGKPAPALSGVSFDGKKVTIANDGRAKAILFLAHWCSHCQAEVPRVQQWLNTTGPPANVDLYSVSTLADETRGNYPPSAWLEREKWTLPVLVDDADASAAKAFGLTGTPMWVFINSDGTVSSRNSGETPIDMLERALAALR